MWKGISDSAPGTFLRPRDRAGCGRGTHRPGSAFLAAHQLPTQNSTLQASIYVQLTPWSDRVVSSRFEHIQNLDDVLRELLRLLKPGGELHASVDALASIRDPELLARHRRDHYVVQYFTQQTLRRQLEAAGFEVLEIYPLMTVISRGYSSRNASARWTSVAASSNESATTGASARTTVEPSRRTGSCWSPAHGARERLEARARLRTATPGSLACPPRARSIRTTAESSLHARCGSAPLSRHVRDGCAAGLDGISGLADLPVRCAMSERPPPPPPLEHRSRSGDIGSSRSRIRCSWA